MTCIVGLVEDGVVYMAGDSAGVSGWNLSTRRDPKVFKVGDFVIGFTSSFRMGQLLRFSLNPKPFDGKKSLYAYMCTDFIEAVRKCLKDGGYSRRKDGEETGGTFLVGTRGQLFQIDDDFQVAENYLPFDSVGCGDSYAKGSLLATHEIDMKPFDKVMKALQAAQEFSAGVRAPFTIETLEEKKR